MEQNRQIDPNQRRLEQQSLVVRRFFCNLAPYLLIDLILIGFTDAPQWAVVLILTAETAALLALIQHDYRTLYELERPLEALSDAAGVLSKDDLTAEDLQQLARRLDEITVKSLNGRVNLPNGQAELRGLEGSINSMLERLDKGYQAQARFVSDASHELRTPIAVIQGYADLLRRWGKDDPSVRDEAINAIREETAYMSDLVQKLLFLARGDNETQTVKLAPFCLSELAEDVLRETELLHTGHSVEGDIAQAVYVKGDLGLIKEAMRVIVDNAVKYTPQGGTISLRLTASAGSAHFSVADTGPGISGEDQTRIFEQFYRADKSRSRETGGTGLGLPIGRWIAQRHGGSLTVSSVVGLGSRFTLTLPLLELGELEDAASE